MLIRLSVVTIGLDISLSGARQWALTISGELASRLTMALTHGLIVIAALILSLLTGHVMLIWPSCSTLRARASIIWLAVLAALAALVIVR